MKISALYHSFHRSTIVQIGLALKSHDAGQRAQGFMTFFGGVIIYFAKDILDMIL